MHNNRKMRKYLFESVDTAHSALLAIRHFDIFSYIKDDSVYVEISDDVILDIKIDDILTSRGGVVW